MDPPEETVAVVLVVVEEAIVEFRVLGPLEIVDGSRRVSVPQAKQRTLLAALLIHANEVVSADRLLDELWGPEPPRSGVKAVHYHVSKLRRVLRPERGDGDRDRLQTRPPGYVLEVAPDELDATRFERLADEGRLALDDDPARAEVLLNQALTLWRGPAYGEFEFEDFARAEIGRLEEMRLGVVEDRLEAMLALGRTQEAVTALESLLHDQPLRERLWGMLMLGLYRLGRQAEALRAFGEASRRLGEELGIEPTEDLRRLEERILLHDPDLAWAPLHPHNLVAAVASFVGREDLLVEIARLLDGRRLVTLTGPGGVGKSRLALETGWRQLERYPHGVWWVEVGSVVAPGLLTEQVATTAGVRRERSGSPVEQTLTQAWQGRPTLLILDNCEHVIPETTRLAGTLLGSLPELRILVTSREPLHLPGETIVAVAPLAVPDPGRPLDELAEYPAVRLFCDRAAAVASDFRLSGDNGAAVARLCAQLDGIPLALELAAGRSRLLPPAEMVDRLQDRLDLLAGGGASAPPHHRSLAAAVAWSHDLLDRNERTLFRRLAVFAGGFTLAAAERVCGGDGIDPDAVVDLLGGLVDKSLVTTRATPDGGIRCGMLETLRLYAWQRFETAEECNTLRDRHLDYFHQWAAEHGGLFQWPRDQAAVEEWHREHPNLQAALGWALESGKAPVALAIAADTWRSWHETGAYAEGSEWLRRCLARSGRSTGLTAIRALNGAGALAAQSGDFENAEAHYRQAIALARAQPERDAQRLLMSALGNLAEVLRARGDNEGAATLLEEAATGVEEIGHPHLDAFYHNQTLVHLALDDLAAAERALSHVSGSRGTHGDPSAWLGALLRWLRGDTAVAAVEVERLVSSPGELKSDLSQDHLLAALVARDRAQPDDALRQLSWSLAAFRQAGSSDFFGPNFLAWWLRTGATIHADLRHLETAVRLGGAADALQGNSPGEAPGWQQRDLERHLDQVRVQMNAEVYEGAWEQGRALTVEEACEEALSPGTGLRAQPAANPPVDGAAR